MKRFIISENIWIGKGGVLLIGRFRIEEGINEHKHISKKPEEINFDEFLKKKGQENVYILAHRPGIGKTYNIIKFLKKKVESDKDFKFFYFTDRHSSIEEHTKDWNKRIFSHWMGFDKICINPRMKNLYKYHIWPDNICLKCKFCKGYQNQFDDDSHVFAPFNYLSSKHFKKSKPDIVFIDENPKQFTSYIPDTKRAIKLFESMDNKYITNLIKGKKWNIIEKKYPYDKIYFKYQDYIFELNKEKTKNKKILDFIEKFNIYNFYQYIHWENIYGYGLKSYGVPNQFYDAFDTITRGIPVVFMDATFNTHFFYYLLESYTGERKQIGEKGFTNLNISIFREHKDDFNKESIIYRMKPEDSIPKNSFTNTQNWERTKETWLTTHLKLIMKVFGQNNVGIITYKELGDFSKAIGYNVEFYGNLRGTNTLKDKPVLVLLGSYLPIITSSYAKRIGEYRKDKKYFDDLLSEYFLLDANEKNLVSVGLEAPEIISKSYNYSLAKVYQQKYIGKKEELLLTPSLVTIAKPAEMLSTILWYDEIYQAFHRNRPLRYKRIIFAYCWFPEPRARIFKVDENNKITDTEIGRLVTLKYNIREEFKQIEKVQNDDINHLFDFLSETDYGKGGLIEEIIEYILQHPNVTSKELTERYKIFKKGEKRGADTIPMTDLIRTLKTLKDKAKRLDLKQE